jgi:hypothetical protein
VLAIEDDERVTGCRKGPTSTRLSVQVRLVTPTRSFTVTSIVSPALASLEAMFVPASAIVVLSGRDADGRVGRVLDRDGEGVSIAEATAISDRTRDERVPNRERVAGVPVARRRRIWVVFGVRRGDKEGHRSAGWRCGLLDHRARRDGKHGVVFAELTMRVRIAPSVAAYSLSPL